MNPHGGRDHFVDTYTNMFMGGGVKPGLVIGKTSETGAKVLDIGWKFKEQPMMDHVASTIYSALGIDYSKKIEDTPSGRAYEYQQTLFICTPSISTNTKSPTPTMPDLSKRQAPDRRGTGRRARQRKETSASPSTT